MYLHVCTSSRKEMGPAARAALNLDLSSIVFMQNAAEPIRAGTVSRNGGGTSVELGVAVVPKCKLA